MALVQAVKETSSAKQLKSLLLLKDLRIERLEQENRRLRDHIENFGRHENNLIHAEAREAAEHTAKRERLALSDKIWNIPIRTDFVRLAGPVHGVHSDGWAEPKARIALVSARPLTEAKLEIWFRPIGVGATANLAVKLDGAKCCDSQLEIKGINILSFPLSIKENTPFELETTCDHRSPVEPPDTRTLSYVLGSLMFG